jgi:hypothetical protein
VIDTVAWVNLMPALDLLAKEHELLPSFFYQSLRNAMSRWFRVYDLEDARMRWDDWIEMRAEFDARGAWREHPNWDLQSLAW